MDDNDIVNLLKRDQSLKEAPKSEWASIKYKIDQSSSAKGWKIALLACSMALVAVFIRQQEDNSTQNIIVTDEEVYEFIMSDGYFDSAEETYAWIGSSQL